MYEHMTDEWIQKEFERINGNLAESLAKNAVLRAELLQKTQELDMVENDKINAQMNLEHIEADLAHYRTAEAEGRTLPFNELTMIKMFSDLWNACGCMAGEMGVDFKYCDCRKGCWKCIRDGMKQQLSARAALEAQGK